MALASLQGRWAPVVVASIVMMAFAYVIYGPYIVVSELMMNHFQVNPIFALVTLAVYLLGVPLVFMPLDLGYTYASNRLLVEGDSRLTGNVFRDGFGRWGRNVWGLFLVRFFTSLWSLLLIVPGIVKFYAYSMTPYILVDNPELSANEAINLSQKMMKGHKFDLFWLGLSFIGWFILGFLTLGVAYLWLVPYMYTSVAAFYQDLKKEYINPNN